MNFNTKRSTTKWIRLLTHDPHLNSPCGVVVLYKSDPRSLRSILSGSQSFVSVWYWSQKDD